MEKEAVTTTQLHVISDDQSVESDPVAKIGHKPTVPRVLDRLLGLIGVNSSIVCPWPNFYFVSTLNLFNGGTAGLIVGTVISCIFMNAVYISLAEKIRKYPTTGGQYHFVAALAPQRARKFSSYLCCCILTFTWLSFLGAAAWLLGLDITAIVLLWTGEYHVRNTFIAAIYVQVAALVINLTWGKHMNIPEMLVLVFHAVAFIFFVCILGIAISDGLVSSDVSFTSGLDGVRALVSC